MHRSIPLIKEAKGYSAWLVSLSVRSVRPGWINAMLVFTRMCIINPRILALTLAQPTPSRKANHTMEWMVKSVKPVMLHAILALTSWPHPVHPATWKTRIISTFSGPVTPNRSAAQLASPITTSLFHRPSGLASHTRLYHRSSWSASNVTSTVRHVQGCRTQSVQRVRQ